MKAIKRIKLKILHICIHFLKGMKQDVELNQKFNLKNIKMVKNYRKNYVSVVTLFLSIILTILILNCRGINNLGIDVLYCCELSLFFWKNCVSLVHHFQNLSFTLYWWGKLQSFNIIYFLYIKNSNWVT